VKEKEAKLDLLGEPEVLGVDYWSGKGSAKRAFKKWNGVILFSITWGIPTGREQTNQFIPDPDFDPSRIPDPKTAIKETGEKKISCHTCTFFVAINFTKF
jgi:hypothetical protein